MTEEQRLLSSGPRTFELPPLTGLQMDIVLRAALAVLLPAFPQFWLEDRQDGMAKLVLGQIFLSSAIGAAEMLAEDDARSLKYKLATVATQLLDSQGVKKDEALAEVAEYLKHVGVEIVDASVNRAFNLDG